MKNYEYRIAQRFIICNYLVRAEKIDQPTFLNQSFLTL